VARAKALNQLRQKRHQGNSLINDGLEKLLAILVIGKAAAYGGNLNGKNVQQIFQKSDTIFLQVQELLLGADVEDGRCNNEEVINIVHRYSE
jgi:hypothetical protein